MMFPIIFALLFVAMLAYRTGENVAWKASGSKGDPPSFRRWQERQRRRGAGSSITGRAEARRFWANVWHDAHASAHEHRQRRRGRRVEDRRRRWRAEDLKREEERQLAPCVFCGAGRGQACRPDCVELEPQDTVPAAPPETGETVPGRRTEPDHEGSTAPRRRDRSRPTEPSTEPTNRATTTEPRPSQVRGTEPTGPSHRATPDRATTAPGAVPTAPTGGRSLAGPGPGTGGRPSESEGEVPAGKEKALEPGPGSNVTRIDKNNPAAPTPQGSGNTNGGNVTTPARYGNNMPAPTGEFAGFEATVAGWETIQRLGAQLDAAYESQMAQLRHNKADAQTIGKVAEARERNEAHMMAATEAKTDWVNRQGAVKETKDATGARGDEALHIN